MRQVVLGAPIAVAEPVQYAMDGGRGHRPTPSPQPVGQIGDDPSRDWIARVEGRAREQPGECLVGSCVQLAGPSRARAVSQSVTSLEEKAVAPVSTSLAAAVSRLPDILANLITP